MILKYKLQYSLAETVLCLFASCSSSKQEGMKDITQLPTYKVKGVKYRFVNFRNIFKESVG